MAYQTHHCSAAFRCSVCLIAFLHTSLALSVLPLFMLCAPCPFTAQFLFCALQLLHSPPSSHMNHLHQQHSQQPPTATATTTFSSLYCVFIASVHLVHAMFAMPLHADSCAVMLHLSSALSDHHRDSSASLAVFPRVQHHWMLC
jgi:hypothetical protein